MNRFLAVALLTGLLQAACAPALAQRSAAVPPRASEVGDVEAMRELFRSFEPRGQADLHRLVRDDVQQFCSGRDWSRDKAGIQALEKSQLSLVKYPADGRLIGDWRRGETIAQTGVGLQYSDNPRVPAGGNCYACHQLSGQELSFGTIGPSLRNFAKTRGSGPDAQRYAFAKIYNPQAFSACSNMPRFGHNGILSEDQIRDLVGLLLDPESPVNK